MEWFKNFFNKKEGSSMVTKAWGIGLDTDLRVVIMGSWDGAEAEKTIWEWATDEDGVIDSTMARRLFTYWDSPGELKGQYKSPVGMVIDGEPVLVLEGIDAARSFNDRVGDVSEELKMRGSEILDRLAEETREGQEEKIESLFSVVLF